MDVLDSESYKSCFVIKYRSVERHDGLIRLDMNARVSPMDLYPSPPSAKTICSDSIVNRSDGMTMCNAEQLNLLSRSSLKLLGRRHAKLNLNLLSLVNNVYYVHDYVFVTHVSDYLWQKHDCT